MDSKYAAVIMKRLPLKENDYLFYCDHVMLGEYDDESAMFMDQEGSIYFSMMSPYAINPSNVNYYYYLLNLDDYKMSYQLHTDDDMKLFLKEFEDLSRKKFFYLGKDLNNTYNFTTIDKDHMNHISTNRGTIGDKSRYGDHYTIDADLDKLQGEIYDEKYSNEELVDLILKLKDSDKELQNLIKIICDYALNDENKTIEENKINIDDLFQKVTKTLIAQDEPARRVITEIARKEMDARKKKEGILLTGPTGIGKTELMRLIAKNINRPFFKVDSTQLTMPGYVGKDIEEVLWDLYKMCDCDVDKAEQAIIFFDEIDKKGSNQKSDPSGQGVINVLLPFIEGSTYDACPDTKYSVEKVKISTANMTVILGGAFMDVYKDVKKNNFGFVDSDSYTRDKGFTTKEFVDCGMMTDEFMSRVTVIKLNELDVESIKRIMLESDQSAMKIQQDIFHKLGVKLTFTDQYTTTVAQNAYEKKTGARGLNGIIDESTWRAFDEVYSHPNEYEEAILGEETLENPDHYQLIKKIR